MMMIVLKVIHVKMPANLCMKYWFNVISSTVCNGTFFYVSVTLVFHAFLRHSIPYYSECE